MNNLVNVIHIQSLRKSTMHEGLCYMMGGQFPYYINNDNKFMTLH